MNYLWYSYYRILVLCASFLQLDFVYAELEFVESKLLHSSSQPTRTQKVLIKLQKLKKTVKDIRATQQVIHALLCTHVDLL